MGGVCSGARTNEWLERPWGSGCLRLAASGRLNMACTNLLSSNLIQSNLNIDARLFAVPQTLACDGTSHWSAINATLLSVYNVQHQPRPTFPFPSLRHPSHPPFDSFSIPPIPRTMDHHSPQVPSISSRLDRHGNHIENPGNNRRTHAGPFSDSAALLGQHLDSLANNNFTGSNGSHSPMRSLDETLDLLDGLNFEVSGVIL